MACIGSIAVLLVGFMKKLAQRAGEITQAHFDSFLENSRHVRKINRSVEKTKREQIRQSSQVKDMQCQIQNVGGRLDTFASNAHGQLKDKRLLTGGDTRKKQKPKHNDDSDDGEEKENDESGGESKDSDIGRLREAKAEARDKEMEAGGSCGDNLFTHMPAQLRETMAATNEAILNVEVHNKLVKFASCTSHKRAEKTKQILEEESSTKFVRWCEHVHKCKSHEQWKTKALALGVPMSGIFGAASKMDLCRCIFLKFVATSSPEGQLSVDLRPAFRAFSPRNGLASKKDEETHLVEKF